MMYERDPAENGKWEANKRQIETSLADPKAITQHSNVTMINPILVRYSWTTLAVASSWRVGHFTGLHRPAGFIM